MLTQKYIVEKGIVKSIHGNRARVEIIKQNPKECKSCGVCVGIESNVNLLEVDVIPDITVGQQVMLQITGNSSYKSIVLLFVIPIFSLITGSLIGQKIPFICQNSQDMRMAFCGFIFFLLSIAAISRYDKKTRSKKYSHRKIIPIDNLVTR